MAAINESDKLEKLHEKLEQILEAINSNKHGIIFKGEKTFDMTTAETLLSDNWNGNKDDNDTGTSKQTSVFRSRRDVLDFSSYT